MQHGVCNDTRRNQLESKIMPAVRRAFWVCLAQQIPVHKHVHCRAGCASHAEELGTAYSGQGHHMPVGTTLATQAINCSAWTDGFLEACQRSRARRVKSKVRAGVAKRFVVPGDARLLVRVALRFT